MVYILGIKGKERIKEKERLNLNKLKNDLNNYGKKAFIFEGDKSKSSFVLKRIKEDIKEGDWVILIVSNSTRLNLDIDIREGL